MKSKLAEKVAELKENKEKVKELKAKFRKWRHKNPENQLAVEFGACANAKHLLPSMKEEQVRSRRKTNQNKNNKSTQATHNKPKQTKTQHHEHNIN